MSWNLSFANASPREALDKLDEDAHVPDGPRQYMAESFQKHDSLGTVTLSCTAYGHTTPPESVCAGSGDTCSITITVVEAAPKQ